MSNSKQETIHDDCSAINRALEMKDRFISPNSIVPYPTDDSSVRFINIRGEYVCEPGVIMYWKLTEDVSDSRYVVQYGWIRNRLFLIDSYGKEDDPGLGLFIDAPYSWGDEGDCSFIKYYPSGLFLIKLHDKYGFAIVRCEGIPYQYDSVEEVNDSLLIVKVANLCGLLDIYGRELTPVKYGWIDVQELRAFSNVVVRDFHLLSRGYVINKDDYGVFRMAVLDITGREVIPSLSYKCISRFRHEQELDYPLFVVSSSCWKMTIPTPNESYCEDLEIDSYRGERLSSHQWGISYPEFGEIVPQDYDMFSILNNENTVFILCHHGCYSILYDLNGSIILGCAAEISVYKGYFVLSWSSNSFSVLNKDLMLLMKECVSSRVEIGSFMCNIFHNRSSTLFDDPPACLFNMTEFILPENALLNKECFSKLIDRVT